METGTPDAKRRTPDALRSFWLMFVVEFQNAFSDNTLKLLVTFFILGLGLSHEKRDGLVGLVGTIFAVPFVLFSMAGGFFADRFSKRSVAIAVKCAELGIMSVVVLAFWLGNIPLMFAAIALMSTHSAILVRRNTACCRNCCRRKNCPGATAFSASAPFPPPSPE